MAASLTASKLHFENLIKLRRKEYGKYRMKTTDKRTNSDFTRLPAMKLPLKLKAEFDDKINVLFCIVWLILMLKYLLLIQIKNIKGKII